MNNLNKIINLIKKTGDKFIINDPDPFDDHSFVIMPFSEYEKIVEDRSDYKSMSEKELLNSVERDISLWRAEHEDEDFEDEFMPPEPEPWEMERPWEREPRKHEPLPFSEEESLPWDKDEDESDHLSDISYQEDENFEKWKNKVEKEAIEDVAKEHEPIKYEDIPPPPDVNIDDVMNYENLPIGKEDIIDIGREDELSNEDEEWGEEVF